MNKTLDELRIHLRKEGVQSESVAKQSELMSFSKHHSLLLPSDLADYFESINGAQQYDSNFFRFYPLEDFKSIWDTYSDWEGIPDFKAVVGVLPGYENVFVVADYSIHVFSYCIRLLPFASSNNEVYVVCGPKYKIVANSFTEFIDLYMCNIDALFF